MEFEALNIITVTIHNTTEENEIADFCDLIRKCYQESRKAGLKNMFDDNDRAIIRKLMEGLSITAEHEQVNVAAGDTHTVEVYNS